MRFLIIAGFADSVVNFRGPLMAALQRAGFEVHVAVPDPFGELARELLPSGIHVHDIPLSRTGMNLLVDVGTFVSLWRLTNSIRPTHSMGYTLKPVVYGSFVAWLARVPHRFAMITGLGYAFQGDSSRGAIRWLVRHLYRTALSRLHTVFFQNPDDESLFRDMRILAARTKSVVVNGSGVDLSRFQIAPLPPSGTRFLLIARLLGDKGVREYAEAARIVRAAHPATTFTLVGWIDEHPNSITRRELDEWVADGTIKYLGRMSDVRPAISACSVYVLPSYREGTPRTVLEAMAMGRAVITTDAPGCRETVSDGWNGFLIPAKSPIALATAMRRFILNPTLAGQMGARSRKIAEVKYDVHKINAVMLEEMGVKGHRILLATTVPDTFATILRGQPKNLARHFHVRLVTSPAAMFSRVELQESVKVEGVPMTRGITVARDILSILRMIGLLRRYKPDLVHSYTPKAGLVTMLAAKICGVPVRLHTFTGLIFPTEQGIKRHILVWADRLICACATHVVPEGEGVRRDLAQFRITRKAMYLIGHGNIAGVDTTHFSRAATGVTAGAYALRQQLGIEEGDFVFCYVGRLNRDKGLTELITSFASLSERARLLLVGAADQTAPLRRSVVELIETHPRVHSLGFMDDVRPALAATDVLVLPSYREGFPNTLLEGGAMELPAIATDINGSNEVIQPGLNGWLVPPRNTAALSRAMNEALSARPAVLSRMGAHARCQVKARFERLDHWNRLVHFYATLLRGR